MFHRTRPLSADARTPAANRLRLGLLIGIAHWPLAANAQVEFEDDHLLICEVVLEDYLLARDVFLYNLSDGSVYLPLQPLVDALDFAVTVDVGNETAAGWFRDEDSTFELDRQKQLVSVRGVERTLRPQDVRSDGFDLYVRADAFAEWFDLSYALDVGRLQLAISSARPLPLQRALEREANRRTRQLGDIADALPVLQDQYRRLSSPLVDVSLGGTVSRGESPQDNGLSYAMRSSFDLLGMQANLAVSGDRGTDSSRLTFRRSATTIETPFPEVTDLAMGDVNGVGDELVFDSGSGLGFDVQLGGRQASSDFGKRVIEGEAKPGWEVELYRNNLLVDFARVGVDGRYRFEDVAVGFGENLFEVRLYGPQGQEAVRRERLTIGDQLPPGKVYARASYVDERKGMLARPEGGGDARKSLAFVKAGVTERMSLVLAAAREDREVEGAETSVTVGADVALPRATFAARMAQQSDGGRAVSVGVQTRVGPISLSAQHKAFDDFESERNEHGRIRDVSEVRASALIGKGDHPVSMRLEAERQTLETGTRDTAVELALAQTRRYNRFGLTTSYLQSGDDTSIRSGFDFRRRFGASSVATTVGYQWHPKPVLAEVATTASFRINERMRAQIAVQHDALADRTSGELSAAVEFDRGAVSAVATIDQTGNSALYLGVEFSLSRESRAWRMYRAPQADFGRIRARAFIDRDYDGQFTDADQALSGVRFSGHGGWRDQPTKDNGVVYLRGLPPGRAVPVRVDEASLEDPYLKPDYEPVAVLGHAGGLHVVDVPLVPTAEAEGSVVLRKDGHERPLSRVPLIVRDADGEVVQRLRTEFDGFFVVDGLRPGRYTVAIDLDQFEMEGAVLPQPVPFEADPDRGVTFVPQMVIEQNSVQPRLAA